LTRPCRIIEKRNFNGRLDLEKDRSEEFKKTLRKRPCGIKIAKETTLSYSLLSLVE
jgi:hypothetical protein